MKFSSKLTALAVMSLGLLTTQQALAETLRAKAYYLVSLEFTADGYRLADNPKLLPCDISTESEQGQDNDSVLRLFDRDNKPVYTMTIINPRVAFFESGDNTVALLKEGRIDLKLPAETPLALLEFWENRELNEPSVKVELANAERVDVQCEGPTYRSAPTQTDAVSGQ